MNILFYLACAMIAGLIMTRFTKLLNLPNVTAYLLAGVLIGPNVSNLLGSQPLSRMGTITECALAFIAFSIGGELKLTTLKEIGKPALIITLCEAFGAVILVTTITMALGFDKVICIMLGALSASTAPAATLLIVRQYKAEGPLTRMLLPVVAADDGIGLIAYSICVSIALSLASGVAMSFTNTILIPLLDILLALLAGCVLGFLMALSHRLFKSNTNRMAICIAIIMLGASVASYFDLSSLLLCMGIGIAFANLSDGAEEVYVQIEAWTAPMFMLFFVISGAQLDLSILPKIGLIGLVYVVARFGGKYIGAYIGGSLMKQPDVVKKNIGWALMPQAGVAIGMATMALAQLPPEYGPKIQTVILAATLVYEIVGPLATRTALQRAGEIHV